MGGRSKGGNWNRKATRSVIEGAMAKQLNVKRLEGSKNSPLENATTALFIIVFQAHKAHFSNIHFHRVHSRDV